MALDFLRRTNRDRERFGTRVPPNQCVTAGLPVLTYGGTPRVDLNGWPFQVVGAVDEELTLTWEEFNNLPQADVQHHIHCVTGWSKMDNDWRGVPFLDLYQRAKVKPDARYVMLHSYGGYKTNVPLNDLTQDEVPFTHRHHGKPFPAEHGGPLRLVMPHLYFWKSAKWARGLFFMPQVEPGFWEQYGSHLRRDPWKEERYS